MKKVIDLGVLSLLSKANLLFDAFNERWEPFFGPDYGEMLNDFHLTLFKEALVEPITSNDPNVFLEALDKVEALYQDFESKTIHPQAFDSSRFKTDFFTLTMTLLMIGKTATQAVKGDGDYLKRCMNDAAEVANHIANGGSLEDFEADFTNYERYQREQSAQNEIETNLNINRKDLEDLGTLDGMDIDALLEKIHVDDDSDDEF